MIPRRRRKSDPKLLAQKIVEAERKGKLEDVKREDVTEVLELTAERLAKSTADTTKALEGTLQSTLPPPSDPR